MPTVIMAAGGRWIFRESGTPLDFEDRSSYDTTPLRNRFPAEMLRGYCAALGIRPWDLDAYQGDQARLLATTPPAPPHRPGWPRQ